MRGSMRVCSSMSMVCALLVSSPSLAQEDSTTRAYASAFASGLQAWAESDYASAVTHMSRAYAIKPSAKSLRMVVRAYDMMGHCSAVRQQQALLRVEHGSGEAVELQRCVDPAQLVVRCDASDVQVEIDEAIRATCNTPMLVAAGEHVVSISSYEVSRKIQLRPGERAEIELRTTPRKWPKSRQRATASVPRIMDGSDRYTVYLSRDGIYQIWVRHDAPELLSPYGE